MKELYWIDDDINQLNNYVKGIFKELWGNKEEDGIASNIIIFGDGYKRGGESKDWNQKSVDSLTEKIQSSMLQHCHDLEMWNWSGTDGVLQDKKKLIEQKPKLVDIKEESINKLISEWKNVKSVDDLKNNLNLDVKELLNTLNVPIGSNVMIDLVLLDGDRQRVLKEELPIISMKIYEELTNQGYKCILYSAYTYDYPFIEKWKEIYNCNKMNGKNVEKVFSGREMLEKAGSSIISELKNLTK